ncbi:Clp protease [Pseudaeromonas phage vB_PpeM_ KLEP7]|nr:Clp protease [Pseudaeromonas phage vB_PpeM_ KLEP7]
MTKYFTKEHKHQSMAALRSAYIQAKQNNQVKSYAVKPSNNFGEDIFMMPSFSKRVEIYPIARRIVIRINSAIGEPMEWSEEVSAIQTATENDIIHIYINSPGGNLFTTTELLSAILQSKAHIITEITGEACSAGMLLFLAGHEFMVSDDASAMCHGASYGAYGTQGQVHDNVMHSTKHLTKLAYKYYEGFLETDEIERLLEGKEYWMEAEEIIERLEKRADYWEKKLAEEIAKETPEAETKTISFDLSATEDELEEQLDKLTEAFYDSENTTLDNLLKPEVKKQGVLDGYDWVFNGYNVSVGNKFSIDPESLAVNKDGEEWGEFYIEEDWSDDTLWSEWNMMREDWKFTAGQLGIKYPPTLSTKLIAKRCQEFCLKVVEEYLS